MKERRRMQPRRAPAESSHPKKTFWERFGLYLTSLLASLLFAAVWVVIVLLSK
ncbi:MAG: hypothetical protein MJ088_04150 [Clostridia bacterium]|nr:hypothetical protein [Clostridia bacterium]